MKDVLKQNFIYIVVILIVGLLLADIFITSQNNAIIEKNKELQINAEKIKSYYDQIGKLLINAADIGLRGYAINKSEKFVQPLYNTIVWKDSIFNNVEEPLLRQKYNLEEFLTLKDSINTYIDYCFKLKYMIDSKKEVEFLEHFNTDKGAYLWWKYVQCGENIFKFENKIKLEAEHNHRAAIVRNELLNFLIFIIVFPTLLYTAFHTNKTFKLSKILVFTKEEKNKLLREQNEELERLVVERTKEILAQNEEIAQQRDALSMHNEELIEARMVIEKQNKEIHLKNTQLELEVESRTLELENANKELVAYNNQLEQFAFITAHNLRAPLARILGLANVIEISESTEEKDQFTQYIVSSTKEMDTIIKDLNVILEIRKHTSNLIEVNLSATIARVCKLLEKELTETDAKIHLDLESPLIINAVGPYVESIIYNLLSNAIKYRDPEKLPVISIKTSRKGNFICLAISDNGLGIDLNLHKGNIFNLYKRFHHHMEGKGLGLHLVKTQISSMGGKIEVESTPGRGTTFFVYFSF